MRLIMAVSLSPLVLVLFVNNRGLVQALEFDGKPPAGKRRGHKTYRNYQERTDNRNQNNRERFLGWDNATWHWWASGTFTRWVRYSSLFFHRVDVHTARCRSSTEILVLEVVHAHPAGISLKCWQERHEHPVPVLRMP